MTSPTTQLTFANLTQSPAPHAYEVTVRYHLRGEMLGWGWQTLPGGVRMCSTAQTAQCRRKVVATYPGIQIHDEHVNASCCSDLSNRPLETAQQCSDWCCADARCVAYFFTTNQSSSTRNCTKGGSCCWLKPTFNASRLDDRCRFGNCVSGVFAPPAPAAAAKSSAAHADTIKTVWQTVYRVAESSFTVDYLDNHNAGDIGGEVAFLSDSGNFAPVAAKAGGDFFDVPSIPRSDPCLSELNKSCEFLGKESCMHCVAKTIAAVGSAASKHCSNSESKGRWWGAHLPKLFCNVSGGFFDFERSPIVEYCVETAVVSSTPIGKYTNGVPYTSCNAPEGEAFGNTARRPICISAAYADRVIGHQTKQEVEASCGVAGPSNGWYPRCNVSGTDTVFYSSSSLPYRHMGTLSVYSPFYYFQFPGTGYMPGASAEIGTWFAFPAPGACNQTQSVGDGGCTWKRQPRSRILWGVDLLAAGWNASNTFDERTGDRANMTTMVSTNIAAFRRALAKLGPAPRCGPIADV